MSTVTDLSNVRTGVEHANGLPNAHYIDPGVYAEERQAIAEFGADYEIYRNRVPGFIPHLSRLADRTA